MKRASRLPLLVALAAGAGGPGVVRAVPAAQLAQQARASAVAVVSPDAPRVGEPFVLGVRVRAHPGTEVLFPPAIAGGEAFEQVAPTEVARDEGSAGGWRAYYRLVAWRSGELELPEVAVRVADAAGAAELRATAPRLRVRSVLPADTAGLELRAARAPLSARSIPWVWLVLALLAALLLAAWLRRRARRPAPEMAGEPPAGAALRALAALRADLEAGRVWPQVGYDRLEAILRGYLETTRGWPAGEPLREPVRAAATPGPGRPTTAAVRPDAADRPGIAVLGDGLLEPLRRSALARFARLGVERGEASADAEACARWVRRDVEALASTGGAPPGESPGPSPGGGQEGGAA